MDVFLTTAAQYYVEHDKSVVSDELLLDLGERLIALATRSCNSPSTLTDCQGLPHSWGQHHVSAWRQVGDTDNGNLIGGRLHYRRTSTSSAGGDGNLEIIATTQLQKPIGQPRGIVDVILQCSATIEGGVPILPQFTHKNVPRGDRTKSPLFALAITKVVENFESGFNQNRLTA